jgi:chemotaxis response regulator CheB
VILRAWATTERAALERFSRPGAVIAEAKTPPVIYRMPGSAVRAGVVTRSLPLSQIADQLEELVR